MRADIVPGAVFPDYELPDENGVMHRLSELQGDHPMVLHLSRGEHCPRERQMHRELLKFYEWCAVAFTSLVSLLPNDQHETSKLKISTGANWTFLADEALIVQQDLDIREYTDTHHDASVPHTLVLAPGSSSTRSTAATGSGAARRSTTCGPTSATCCGGRGPTSTRCCPRSARPTWRRRDDKLGRA